MVTTSSGFGCSAISCFISGSSCLGCFGNGAVFLAGMAGLWPPLPGIGIPLPLPPIAGGMPLPLPIAAGGIPLPLAGYPIPLPAPAAGFTGAAFAVIKSCVHTFLTESVPDRIEFLASTYLVPLSLSCMAFVMSL